MQWCKLDKRYTLIYCKLLFFSFLYVFPIILADMYYNDDLARSIRGATGWKGDGRPLGEALILWLNGGGHEPIIDIAPLPMILSIMILSYVLVLYAKRNFDSQINDYMQIMVLLFILMNPFAMSNLSYRFDCIIMFIALSIPFFMYSFPNTYSKVVIAISSFIFGMVIMSLYQPAICMCMVLCVIHIFLFVLGKKGKVFLEFIRIGGVGAGVVVYKLVIARHYVSKIDWRQGASKVVSDFNSIKIIFANIANTCRYIKKCIVNTSSLNVAALGMLILFAILATIILYLRENKAEKVRKAICVSFILVSPIIAFFATFLPLMLLENLDVRSRIFISFGGFLFFIGIMVLNSVKKHKILIMMLCILCILYQYTYMYSYASALKSQNEYQKYMVYNIAHDLETINCDKKYVSVTIIGKTPKAKQTQLICDKYPLINELVPVYFSNDTWLGGAWLYHYLQDDLSIVGEDDTDLQVVNSNEPVINNTIYSCYLNGEKIIVKFN